MLQILQAIIVPVLTDFPEKYNLFSNKKNCCHGNVPTTQTPMWHPRLWQKTLREAAYQSIMRHTEFTGTLDDRLNRDHQLWSKIKEAIFKQKSIPGSGSEITTGILVDRQRRNGNLEFQQIDKSVYECPGERCTTNESLVALWRVRKTQDPNGLWIRVKLPTDQGTPIEDVYEYNVKYGLKRLMKKDKMSTIRSSEANDKMIQDRVDIRFPETNSRDLYMLNMPKPGVIMKPHPAVIVETGRHFVPQPVTNIGAIVATGPDGYRHVIHSLGQFPSPQRQEFQHNSQYNGFLPSIGPIIPPPPIRKPIVVYDTPNQYNPSFVNVYRQTLNNYYKEREQPTPKPQNFKPSKEFIQFSEVDPFYQNEQVTSPMPPYIRPTFTINYPDSINAQLPPTVSSVTQDTTPDTNPQFQIIVGDYPTTKQPHSTLTEATKFDLFTPTTNLITPFDYGNLSETEGSLRQSTVKKEQTTETVVTELNEFLTTLNESILSNMVDININQEYITKDNTSDNSTELITYQTHTTEANIDIYTNDLFSENILNSTLDIIKIMNETTTEHMNTLAIDFQPTMLPEYNTISDENMTENVQSEKTTTYRIPSIFDDVSADLTNKTSNETDFDSIFTSLTNKLFPIKYNEEEMNKTIKPEMTTNNDKEAQESLKDFRLLTYPGDPISIVEHRISTSVSYKTAKGKTGIVPNKEDAMSRKQLTQLIFKNNKALSGNSNSVVGRTGLNTILSHLVKSTR